MDWSNFTRRIFIKADRSSIYNAWSKSGQMEQWFLESATYQTEDGTKLGANENAEKGHHYSWKWNNWKHHQEGKVLQANGKDVFEFTFGKGGNVRINLETGSDRGTEIILYQYDIPTDEEGRKNFHIGCSHGWSFWLVNLKAWLEHGIVLNQTGLGEDEIHNIVNS